MKIQRFNAWLWAAGLVVAGILLLLFNLNVLARYEPLAQYILGGLMLAGGVGFFAAFVAASANWWRLIPGWTLVALAGMIITTTLPNVTAEVTASLLFVGLAAAFAHIYALRRSDNWWAIMPGGFMLVLAAVVIASGAIERVETLGALLFGGLGLVFLALYALTGRNTQWWALIPAAALVTFGLFIFMLDPTGEGNPLLRWWPLLMIALGVLVGWRASRRAAARREMEINQAPSVQLPPLRERTSRPARARWQQPEIIDATPSDYSSLAPGTSVQVLSDDDGDAVASRGQLST